jgi:glutathione peroxidase-family protein
MNQELGAAEEIASFCQKNYGGTFPISEKLDVK